MKLSKAQIRTLRRMPIIRIEYAGPGNNYYRDAETNKSIERNEMRSNTLTILWQAGYLVETQISEKGKYPEKFIIGLSEKGRAALEENVGEEEGR